jgi:hypothetical protein
MEEKMLKIIVSQWDKNKDELRSVLSKRTDLNSVDYIDLVKLSFEVIYNNGLEFSGARRLDLDRIHEIDDGDYQGTLLFLIPFKSYQPCENEYLMTYVGYGSCCVCDTLQAIQDWGDKKLTDRQIDDFMQLCKDILTNTIKPYNAGWRTEEVFEHMEVKNNG